MASLATTHSLNDYPRLSISSYREYLRIAKPDSLPVSYKHRGKHHSYSINLSRTACHFGGYRYWFHCSKCSNRTSVLYCKGAYVCRHCIDANYQSQLQQPVDRLFTRLNAIRARLHWSKGIANKQGGKPHYMHHSTYERLINEYDRLIQKLLGKYRND